MEEIIYFDDMMKAEVCIQKNDDEKFNKIEIVYFEPRPIFQFFNIGGIFKNEKINPEK